MRILKMIICYIPPGFIMASMGLNWWQITIATCSVLLAEIFYGAWTE